MEEKVGVGAPQENVGAATLSREATLRDVSRTIPEDLCQPRLSGAIGSLITAFGFFALTEALAGYFWVEGLTYLYPVAWFCMGISFFSMFLIGHDCAHGSFLKSRGAMTTIGHFFFLPMFYPHYAWKYSHDGHHNHTNKLKRGGVNLNYDNAWIPFTVEEFQNEQRDLPIGALIYKVSRTFIPFGSFIHMPIYLLHLKYFEGPRRRHVAFSLLFILVTFAAVCYGLFTLTGSIFSVFHFWIIPAFFGQIWMAIYTYLHHTAEGKKFYPEDEWTAYKGRFKGTVNCTVPRWLSFLHLNIDIHIPHHVSTKVPCYNLRAANDAMLKSEFGGEMLELKMTWAYLREQVKGCRIWNSEHQSYQSDFPKKEDAIHNSDAIP